MKRCITLRHFTLLLSAFLVIAACRAGDFVAQYSARPTIAVAAAKPSKTGTLVGMATAVEGPGGTEEMAGIEVPAETPDPAEIDESTETADPTEGEEPTEVLDLSQSDVPLETEEPPEIDELTEEPVEIDEPTGEEETYDVDEPTEEEAPVESDEYTEAEEPAETPEPTREFEYLISYSWCGPNRGMTFIEGTVYKDGETVNGLLVRLAVNEGGDPIVNDYRTGTDRKKPGGYTQIIGAFGPRGGLWYLWLVDPDTKRRISDIATIKTDDKYVEDTDEANGSCQSAKVDFSNDLETAPIPEE